MAPYDRGKSTKDQQTSPDNSRDWIKGVLMCAWIMSTVLILNIILTTIAASVAYTKDNTQGFAFASLYTGKCSVAKGWSTGLHVVINILSTAIYNSAAYSSIGPSEYAVLLAHASQSHANVSLPQNNPDYDQCFTDEVGIDISAFRTAMADGKLDMLSKQECIDTFAQDYVSGQRMVILQTAASLPENVPLFYQGSGNADSFTATDRHRHSYKWMCDEDNNCTKPIVEKSINNWSVHGYSWSIPRMLLSVPTPSGSQSVPSSSGLFSGKYGFPDTEDYRHLDGIMMTSANEKELRAELDNPAIWVNGSFARNVKIQGHEAMCGDKDPRNPGRPTNYPIENCLSWPVEETCQLFFSPPICLTVICCTLIKLICAILTAHDDREEVFLTVGDAIASFISRADPATKGSCLLSRSLVDKRRHGWRKAWGVRQDYPDLRRCKELPRHLPPRERWFQAASKMRWLVTLAVCAAMLGPSGFLLRLAITEFNSAAYGSQSIMTYGFGKVGAATLITATVGFSGEISMVLLANTPQLLISIAYFLYNALLTHMLLAVEYNGYAIERKHLRVSWPRGDQRSTYYLSLPYRYSIPLLVMSALLHWLVSQSIFFVQIVPFSLGGVPRDDKIVTCGYSPVAIIFAIVVGSSLVLVAVFLGFCRFRSRMPLAVECSAAISAACHPLTDGGPDRDHALKPVQWGELPGNSVYDKFASSRSTIDLEPRGDGLLKGMTQRCSFYPVLKWVALLHLNLSSFIALLPRMMSTNQVHRSYICSYVI